ncbi:alpha-amylase family glycosyl hydrolase [Limnohabitans sp. 103DPR2]|uniref:alpha-amylase family glycosyl hydrolase n=1 Tax=Limnohabitans sp. 103DPR2 TaxID=1678129 RepID=UPI0006DC5CE8|nr:alpha-amylase family glycosyl hydrolase [Limnohabitans sp. 103DPR2]ALK90486.1 Alpha-amylase 2 [Limnohabitans sp. 103DPR2]
MQHVSWSRSANIYEVNVRQYTPEGTLNAFAAHLPRLQQMGVDILWLMPIHPIGKLKRKGKLGSYYAVSDYKAINPEFGKLKDFKALVQQAHELGMKVIIDWVANHTAWDHEWVKQHPEWYLKNDKGQIQSYRYDNGTEVEDWTDVVGLDYSQKPLWTAMIQAMQYWVKETDIDGFRCDVAHLLPLKFWQQARAKLDAQKPMFMLAESDDAQLHDAAFDMTYDWALQDVLKKIAKGQADVRDLKDYLASAANALPTDGYRMTFTANHDTNSWHNHDAGHFGDAFAAMAVIAATFPGMPLVYGGQESGLNKMLQFFEKDTIDWQNFKHEKLYANLLAMKKKHPALHNGALGAPVEVFDAENHHILAFRRQKGIDVVSVQVNMSGQNQSFNLHGKPRKLGAWEFQIQTS